MSLQDLNLLALLHAGGRAAAPWREFLAQLQRQCSAGLAVLAIGREDGPLTCWTSDPEADAPALAIKAMRQMRPLRVYALDELTDAPSGDPAWFGRLTRAEGITDHSAWLIVLSAERDFAAAHAALLSALAPHVAIAAANHISLQHARMRGAMMEDVLKRAGIALEFVDDARSDRGQGQSLFLRNPDQGAGPAPSGMLLTRTHPPIRPEQLRCLAERWSLTPSEARFALTVSQGKTLAEAAEALGLTLETARHYSKRLYAKTGVSGLPELVHRVLTSVAMLA